MRRVVSLFLPTFTTDRLRLGPTDRLRQQHDAAPPDAPLVTAAHDGHRQVVAAANRPAQAMGLAPGLPLARAQAMVPGLAIVPAAPAEDAAALRDLAGASLRFAPLAAPDPPDGIRVDATGCAHLFGGEAALLTAMRRWLRQQGFAACAAIAGTPGAAHAAARWAGAAATVIPPGEEEAVLAPLPVAALRLCAEVLDGLRRLGLETVGALAAVPRAPLVRRFGPEVALRLDQAFGRVFEPIVPVHPPAMLAERRAFAEPLLTAESFAAVIDRLVPAVCVRLERAGQGARRLDLLFARVDGAVPAIRIGTARPSRDARHLGRLLAERLETIDPGPGVEVMTLAVPLAEPLAWAQADAAEAAPDLPALVDRLANRLGEDRVYRLAPVESDVPERAVRRVPALAPPARASWPPSLPRPARLLTPPQPVEAMALLPDQPPVAFTWRRVRHRVRRADGPERIAGEWWKRQGEVRTVRDYFAVEDEAGRRFWLFRRGDGEDPQTGDLRWFLHGLF